MPSSHKGTTLKRFCLRGHDTATVPRYATGHCRICRRAQYKQWALAENYIKSRHNVRWKRQGILNPDGSRFTIVDFDRAYQVQQGRCKGCGRHQSELNSKLAADHNHATGTFRALLCNACNRILGVIEHDPERLRRLSALL